MATKKKTCGATRELPDGTVLTCDQTDHPFPTHSDNGHAWADDDLLTQTMPVPAKLQEGDGEDPA